MDGTLVHRGQVSPENARWIRTAVESGVPVILATGRPIREVLPVVEALQLSHPLVVNNGSEVWKSPSELHVRHEIDPAWVRKILETAGKYSDKIGGWAHAAGHTFDLSSVMERLDRFRWLQIAVRSDDAAILSEIREEVEQWNALAISNSHITNLEFNAYGITKASGLREISTFLGLPIEEAIAVGDSLNDIPMIDEAGLGVAMGNAQEPVKQAADCVAPSNDQDGVAEVIRKFLLA